LVPEKYTPIQTPETFQEIRQSEQELVKKALKYLECKKGPKVDYASIREIEQKNNVFWIGPVMDNYWYIPKTASARVVLKVINRLDSTGGKHPLVMAALGELWVTTKKAKVGEMERDNTLHSYARRLRPYPPEYALFVINEMIDTQTFFPAWSEIKKRLDRFTQHRAALITCLRTIIKKLGDQPNES